MRKKEKEKRMTGLCIVDWRKSCYSRRNLNFLASHHQKKMFSHWFR